MPYYMPVGLINGHLVCYYMMYCAGPRASKPCWLSTLNYRVCSICLSFLCIVYNTKLQQSIFLERKEIFLNSKQIFSSRTDYLFMFQNDFN